MRNSLVRALVLVGGLLASLPALAQSGGYRDRNGVIIPMMVPACLDSSQRAVPCSAQNPLQITGGGATPSPGAREQDVTESRSLPAALGSQQTYTLNGQSTFSFSLTGLAASGATVTFYASNDWNGTTGNFQIVNEVNTGTGVATTTRATDGQSAIGVEGARAVRILVTTGGTGTITVASNISVRSRLVALRAPLPPGANAIGSILNAFGLESTQQGIATSNAAIAAATGTQADAATASGANTSIIGALKAMRDRLLGGIQINGFDGSVNRIVRTTTTGALEPPTAAAGKITRTSTSLAANTSTTIAAANANRLSYSIQCAAGGVSVDETGAALTGASVGQGTLFVPANPGAYFTPVVATLTLITAYTPTAQICVVTEYNR